MSNKKSIESSSIHRLADGTLVEISCVNLIEDEVSFESDEQLIRQAVTYYKKCFAKEKK